MHKAEEIKIAAETQKFKHEEIPNPSDLKFRPIAGLSCSTNSLIKLIDILMYPFQYKI